MDKALALKIYNVMCETEGLEKDLQVGRGTNSYKAIGEKAVLNMMKPLFKKHKLIFIPRDGTIEEHVVTYIDSYDKNKFRGITQLKVAFMLVDVETGESVDIVGFGNGADSQDKGSGKAFTYAYKTAISKTFMLFSGEDTDNHHSDEMGQKDDKVTTQMLIDAAAEKGYSVEQILKKYEKEYSKTTDVKYIKADVKKKYYEGFKALKGEPNGH